MLSPASSSSGGSAEKKISRQRPGSACEECRRRKLSCDRNQPQCKACLEASTSCIYDAVTSPRGPKKGHMKALQTRMALLEKRLAEQQQNGMVPSMPDMQSMDLVDIPSMDSFLNSMSQSALPSPPIGTNPDHMSMDLLPELRLSQSLELPTSFYISEILRTDFDQLYFERAHPFVPILHRTLYFSWSRAATKTESQVCLQHAMWTLAASLSAQLEHIRESLYEYTCKMLKDSEPKDGGITDIEHVQARILLLIYEFMRTNHYRGWISAGHCFRLLQLMRLYEIDTPENQARRDSEHDPEDWINTEVKRRTFWMAYSLDRFISIRGDWPLTLNEQVISTRLPMPDEDFQKGQCVEMGFLSEAMISIDQSGLSSFAESIILATICGRALAHRQQTSVERAYSSNVPQHFWDRHEWLDTMLRTRVDILQMHYPPAAQHSDSLLLFTNMVANTTSLYLCKVMDSMSLHTSEYRNAIVEFKQRALLAAQEIVNLSRSLAQLSYFKVHPFTPLPLILCADFFNTHRYLDESVDSQVQEILGVMKDITSVNNLAQDYLLSIS